MISKKKDENFLQFLKLPEKWQIGFLSSKREPIFKNKRLIMITPASPGTTS